MVWVDYIRPGFTLSKQIGEGVRDNPAADLVVMGKHGVTVWADSSVDCYAQSIKVIGEAADFITQTSRNAGSEIASIIPRWYSAREVFHTPGSALDSLDRRRNWSAQADTVRSGGGFHAFRQRFSVCAGSHIRRFCELDER